MEEGLKTADPHDFSTYTGWTGLSSSPLTVKTAILRVMILTEQPHHSVTVFVFSPQQALPCCTCSCTGWPMRLPTCRGRWTMWRGPWGFWTGAKWHSCVVTQGHWQWVPWSTTNSTTVLTAKTVSPGERWDCAVSYECVCSSHLWSIKNCGATCSLHVARSKCSLCVGKLRFVVIYIILIF